jgi:hypothetical protein
MTTVPPFRSEVDKDRKDHKEEPLEYHALTGLTWGQLTRLSILVIGEIGSLVKKDAKKPPAVSLFDCKYSEMVWRGRWWLWTALAAVGCDTLVCGG